MLASESENCVISIDSTSLLASISLFFKPALVIFKSAFEKEPFLIFNPMSTKNLIVSNLLLKFISSPDSLLKDSATRPA